MAKRSSTKGKNALKSLFSRSDANLDESAEKDAEKSDGDKKKFKFLKFKTKSRKDEKSAAESQQVLGAIEVSSAAEDGEDGADAIEPKSKTPHLYATAPRSKSKEFSYSELDLRKPKRFATFSFGLRKRKKKDEEKLSKSTFGLDDASQEEKEETPLDLRRVDVDESRTAFSMSQPELDNDYKFDIPSPPPVATTRSESPFTFPREAQPPAAVSSRPDAAEPLTNSSSLLAVNEPRAPIASIPELQLDEDELTVPVEEKSTTLESASFGPVSDAGTSGDVRQTGLRAALSSACTTSSAHRDDVLHETRTESEPLQTVTSPHRPAEAPVTADDSTHGGETFLQSADSELYTTITDLPPVEHNDNPAALSPSHVPGPASASSAVSAGKTQPVDHDGIYGELYDSLFPQGFISKGVSSLSSSAVRPEMGRTKPEPVVIRTFYECHTETDVSISRLPTSHESSGFMDDEASLSSTFTSHLSSTAVTEASLTSDIQAGSLPSYIHYSELSCSHSEAKPGGFSLIQDAVTSALVQNSAPPVSHYGTSRGADAQVTDTKRRVILVKELVTDEASSDPDCPGRMSTAKGPEIKIEAPSGQAGGHEGLLSPAYLSVGSDDGSAMEIYYSAEEDNLEESRDEDMYTVDESEDACVGDRVEEVQVHKDKLYRGGVRGIIVKIKNEGGNEEKMEDFSCQTDVQQQPGGLKEVRSDFRDAEGQFPVSKDGPSQQKAAATTALPQSRGGGGGEGRKEELPATPVEQVNTLMVCEAEPRGQGEGSEGNRSQSLETEAHLNGETQVPGQEQQCLSDKDARGPDCLRAAPSDSGGEKVNTPTLRQAEEPEPARRSRETSRISAETGYSAASDSPPAAGVASGQPTPSAELRSDATEAPGSSEGADPIAQSVNRNGAVSEQVAVEPSASDADAQHPHREAAEVVRERHEHPAEAQPDQDPDQDQDQGSPAADSVCASESPEASAVQESDDNMSKVYSSLSTKLSIKSRSLPKEDESKHRVHKVSLISEAETSGSQDAVDGPKTSGAVSNGTDDSPKYKWKNKFDGVTQFKPSKLEGSLSPTFSSPSPLSPPSSLSEAPAYDFSKTFSSSYFTYSTSSEEHNIPGSRTEAYLTFKSEPVGEPKDEWRRSLVEREEPSAPAGGREGEAESERVKSPWDSPQLPSSHADISTEDFTGVFKATLVDLVPDPPAPPSSPPDSPDVDFSSQFDMDNLVDTLKSMGPSQRPRAALPRAAPPSLLSSLPPIDEDTPAAVLADVPDAVLSLTKPEPSSLTKPEPSSLTKLEPSSLTKLEPSSLTKPEPSSLTKLEPSSLTKLEPSSLTKPEPGSLTKPEPSSLTKPETSSLTKPETSSLTKPETSSLTKPEPGSLTKPEPSSLTKPEPSSLTKPEPSSLTKPEPSSLTKLEPSSLTKPEPSSLTKPEPSSPPTELLHKRYMLPPDLGLKRNVSRDNRSPAELMKQNLQDKQLPASKGLNLPLRSLTTSSNSMRNSSVETSEELKSPVLSENGVAPPSSTGSRLDNSIIFRSYRPSSIDLPQDSGKTHRPLFHANSLPEAGPASEPGSDAAGPRFERFSFLNFLTSSSSSTSGSLTGAEDPSSRMSRPPSLSISSPPSSNSPTRLLSPTGSIDLHRPFAGSDAPLSMFGQTPGMGMGVGAGAGVGAGVGAGAGTAGPPLLQRSFSSERAAGLQQTSLFNSVPFQRQEPEPDRNLTLKYRAFPDAYLTKQKEHGKLNPRPGKMYIFDRPGMCGQRIEIRGDVLDATPWELQETISIRVVRGGWVLYEKPNFKGEKIALDEGDIELTNPFLPPEEHVENEQKAGEEQNGETEEEEETKRAPRFIIGSVRRAVRDYSVPEIGLFPEENAEGKKVIFRDTAEDARIFGFPVKAHSIIINAGLWLVYAQPFFQGVPRVLEVGGYPNPAAWGVEQPYVASVHPLKIGEPRVEYMSEPKIVIYEKPYFTGKSRTITTNMRDFMTRTDRQQNVFMYNVASLKVLGGIWVGYEKEGFRGHQYLLEEGDFHDWRVWGGHNAELRSIRLIRADLTDPLMVMIEEPEEELDMQEENSLEVTEAIPDVEPCGYKTSTRSIHVISGAWVAYSHVDYSGNQYILEKGFYSNCADWGSEDNRICSVQPILLAQGDNSRSRNEIILYSEPDFQGNCHVFDDDQTAVPEKLLTKSCRVAGESWVLYENEDYSGNQYVLSEGDYPSLASMGCPPGRTIRSVRIIPMTLSVPSISLFGLECLEGREITVDTDVISMVEEGYNNHVLSVKVSSGCWVICEHSNYRGRQFLLEPIEITNWPKFSSMHTIGSMYPVRQKRHFFHIRNAERGHYMSVQGGVEELRSGRVVVTPEVEPMSDVWFYQDGLVKNKLSPNMCLQVMGNVEPGSKLVLWSETRQPVQTWTAQMTGLVSSLTFPGFVMDVKGGKSYDKDHVVIMPENEERPSQQWEIELL